MTFGDKLSKRARCILTQTNVDAAEVAQIFLMESYAITDYRVVIISDRGPKLPSKFWKSLMQLMGVKFSMKNYTSGSER